MALRWYVVHVYSGFEPKVVQSIKEQIVAKGMEDLFEEVLVPTEEVVEISIEEATMEVELDMIINVIQMILVQSMKGL